MQTGDGTRKLGMALAVILLTCVLMSAVPAVAVIGLGQPATPPEPVGLIVKFAADRGPSGIQMSANSAQSTGVPEVDAINRSFDIQEMSAIRRSASGMDANAANRQPLERIFALAGPKGTDWYGLKRAYEALPSVEYVELDYPVTFLDVPDDPLHDSQWHLNNTGQVTPRVVRIDGSNNDTLAYAAGIAGADMNMDSLYSNPPAQSTAVVVAVLDGGVDVYHPDLVDNIWINSRDSIANGIDDDHNGFVDDKYGWNFATYATEFAENEPFDDEGHGTHVAGIIAATTDNGVGVAGVCPHARIMSLRIETTSDMAAALVYAADNGADVINMSFAIAFNSPSVASAIQYAYDRGVVLCAAMGNDGTTVENLPAAYPQTIAIGATNDSGYVTYFSTHGDHIDVVAPGQSVLSLRAAETDMYGERDEPGVHIIDTSYYLASGTSMACPAAAGVAAWIRAVSPGLKPAQVELLMEQSARDLVDPLDTDTTLTGWDKYSGYGEVDAYRTVLSAPEYRAILDYPPPFEILSGMLFFHGTADGGPNFPGWILDYGAGSEPTAWTTIAQSSTSQTDGLFTSWIAPQNAAGLFTFRLRVGQDHEVRRSIYLAATTVAEITSPATGDTLSSLAEISGNAYSYQFTQSVLEYRRADDSSYAYTSIDTITTPRFDEVIGSWSLTAVDTGFYWIRLRVETLGAGASDSVLVYVSEWQLWTRELGSLASITANYGDFDNDDSVEIVIGTLETIRFFNTLGAEKFAGMPTIPSGNWRTPIVVGEFDGDGVEDFAGVNLDSNAVYIFTSSSGTIRKDASQVFEDPAAYWNEYESVFLWMAARDVDADGIDELYFHSRPDLITAFDYDYYMGLPQEPDSSPVLSSDVHSSEDDMVFAMDLDGDGIDEWFVHRILQRVSSFIAEVNRQNPPYSGVVDSTTMLVNGTRTYMMCSGMTSADVDGDGESELILIGNYGNGLYYLYSYEAGLQRTTGFPVHLNLPQGVEVVSMPVFADLDNDCEIEFVMTYLDGESSYICAFESDGSFYRGLPVLATVSNAWLTTVTIADVNNDQNVDIVGLVQNNWLGLVQGTDYISELRVWSNLGAPMLDFTMVLTENYSSFEWYTPVIGDLDNNDTLDIVIPYQASSSQTGLAFVKFGGSSFDLDYAPAPQWRVDRGLSNISKPLNSNCPTWLCGDVDGNGTVGDYADITYLVNHLFYGGPPPPVPDAADVNASGTLTMTDVSLLVNYYNGMPVTLTCPGSGSKVIAALNTPVTISARQVDGKTLIELDSPVDLIAVELEFTSGETHTVSLPESSPMSLLSGRKGQTQRIGVIDMTSHATIPAGQSVLVTVDGEVILKSARAVSSDFLEIEPVIKSDNSSTGLPAEFALYDNYPNPFNPSTQISFALPERSDVALVIYNSLGQQVERLVDGALEAGVHTVEWNAQRYSSGVYFYRLTAGSFTATRKMLLIK